MSDPMTFAGLCLPAALTNALKDLNYEQPTPIQEQAIPALLQGRDLLGQAQTGTGKTAAFALPFLSRMDPKRKAPQALVLTPTRELAMQVAESCRAYARYLDGVHTLALYGGQGYGGQLKSLRQGAQVVVGTPGRILDHLGRGTLKLDALKAMILDEGDEMLHMGFIEDVERIISHTPAGCQKALFSATLPGAIQTMARRYLNQPAEIRIASKTATVESIQQHYLFLREPQKSDVLVRLLEIEEYEGVLVFVRTRARSTEVAETLGAAGFPAAALNGDMNQSQRENTLKRLKSGRLKIVVATDVAARGLDVDSLSLVINYDIPQDPEPYVHRIGRTGRAGRGGKAVLFVTPREKRHLSAIEKTIRRKIPEGRLPTSRDLEKKRARLFRERVRKTLETSDLDFFSGCLTELQEELGLSAKELAPALLCLAQQDQPLQVPKTAMDTQPETHKPKKAKAKETPAKASTHPDQRQQKKTVREEPDLRYDRYRLEVGKRHDIRPADIVGAISNEVDLDSRFIGRIRLFDDHSTVELPEGMPKSIFNHLKKVHIRQNRINPSLISSVSD